MAAYERPVLSRREFADRLGLSLDTVKRHIERGKLRHVRLGRRILIPTSEIDRILSEADFATGRQAE